MPKVGDVVYYVGGQGPQKADVVSVNPDGSLNLAAWDGNTYQPATSVPEKKEGGKAGEYGHTWHKIG